MTTKAEKRKLLDGETGTISKKVKSSKNDDLTDDSLKKAPNSSLSEKCDINRSDDPGIKPKNKKGKRSENMEVEKNVNNIEKLDNNSVKMTFDLEPSVTDDHKTKNGKKKKDEDSNINDGVAGKTSESKQKKTCDRFQNTDQTKHSDFQSTPQMKNSKKHKHKKSKEKFDDSTCSENNVLVTENNSEKKSSDDKVECSNSNENSEEQSSSKVKNCKKAKKKKKKKKDKSIAENNDNVEEDGKTIEKSAKELAVLYLKQWKKNRDEWKFQKVRQVWLLTHMYDSEKVNDKNFKTLLKYLDGLKGMGRQTTSAKAQTIVESESEDTVKVDRARQIVQQLSTE